MSARINTEAARLQNATSLAQSISEEFKSFDIDEIINMYPGAVYETDSDGEKTGKITFENLGNGNNHYLYNGKEYTYFQGSGGEKFFVDVVLDPEEYNSDLGINSYILPDLNDLYNGKAHGTMVIKSQVSQYDSYVLTGLDINESQLRDVKKSVKLKICLTYNQDKSGNYYDMDCLLSVEYVYGNRTYKPEDILIETYRLDSNEDIPAVYLCYNAFDIYGSRLLYGNDTFEASDKININYEYNGNINAAKKVKVYLAQQTTMHSTSTDASKAYAELNADNVSVTGSDGIDIYTNIKNWNGNSLTTGNASKNSLYKMTVTVKYGSPDGKVITSINGTKEN